MKAAFVLCALKRNGLRRLPWSVSTQPDLQPTHAAPRSGSGNSAQLARARSRSRTAYDAMFPGARMRCKVPPSRLLPGGRGRSAWNRGNLDGKNAPEALENGSVWWEGGSPGNPRIVADPRSGRQIQSLFSAPIMQQDKKKFLQPAIFNLLFFLIGAVEIQVPELPVVALFGEDASLDCSFTPDANFSLTELSVIWQLTDTKRKVHSFSQGQDQLVDQGNEYVNRTALFYDQLPRGNISLLLRSVQVADEGSFTCFVRVKDHNSAAVLLQVAAPYSKPNLYLDPNKDLKPGDLVTVTCHTFQGYPEAVVTWHDRRGNNITENVTTSQVANEEGLFDVQSILRVVLEPNSTYSCLVKNPVLQEEKHATVTITGQPLDFPAVALWVIVALSICVLVLLGALAYICRKKIRQTCEEEENTGTEEQVDGEELKSATQPLKSSETKEDDREEIC